MQAGSDLEAVFACTVCNTVQPTSASASLMQHCRCKAEQNQLLKTEFGEFTVDNRCWMRTGFSMTQVSPATMLLHGSPAVGH
jgi:hypothetical protein